MGKNRQTMAAVVFALAFILGFTAQGFAAQQDETTKASGIILDASDNIITLAGSVHNVEGVPIFDENRRELSPRERGAALIGKTAEIVYLNGKIIDVLVAPFAEGDVPFIKAAPTPQIKQIIN